MSLQRKKAGLFKRLLDEVLARKAACDYTPPSLALSAQLLALSQEVNSAWNYRRDYLATLQDIDEPTAEMEMEVSEAALRRNPKSYLAWFHRRWIITSTHPLLPLAREYRLLTSLLQLDSRNFHAWDHHRLVDALASPEQRALGSSESMLKSTFGNFSAWHERERRLLAPHGDGDGDGGDGGHGGGNGHTDLCHRRRDGDGAGPTTTTEMEGKENGGGEGEGSVSVSTTMSSHVLYPEILPSLGRQRSSSSPSCS